MAAYDEATVTDRDWQASAVPVDGGATPGNRSANGAKAVFRLAEDLA